MGKVRNLTAVAVLIAALWAGGAAADSKKPQPVPSRLLTGVFQPDPEGVWRTITQTDSTSDCIGDPVTPMCAVDTGLACLQWQQLDLCKIAVKDFNGGQLFGGTPSPRKSSTRYRVVGVRLAEQADLAPRPRGIPNRVVGDMLIDLIDGRCWSDNNCSTHEVPITYTVRKFEGRWLIVDVYRPWY